jgi:hypothetical protein
MALLPPNKIAEHAYNAGVKDRMALITAVAIAMAESWGGDPNAVGDVGLQDSKWGPSIGLWQIRSLKAESGKGTTRDATRLKDPAFNARSMYAISGGGTKWSDWTVYNIKAHALFLPAATAGVGTFLAAKGTDNIVDGATDQLQTAKDMATAVPEALDATYGWISNRKNWLRVAQVTIGGVVIIAGVAYIAKGAVPSVAGTVVKSVVKGVK